MPDIQILSARTVIRPFSPDDAVEVFACISPEITRFMSWEPPPTLDAFEDVWRTWLPSNEGRADLHLVARNQTFSGSFVACIGVFVVTVNWPAQ